MFAFHPCCMNHMTEGTTSFWDGFAIAICFIFALLLDLKWAQFVSQFKDATLIVFLWENWFVFQDTGSIIVLK